jgi:hypothetical protein
MRKTAAGILAATTAAMTFVASAATAGSQFNAAETAKTSATAAGPSQPVVGFTGEYLNGAPVYRLPPVTVAASRAAALAAIQNEDKAAATSGAKLAPSRFQSAVAAPATAGPDRNIALDVAAAALATLAAVALSFGLVSARRRRQQPALPQPRQWVAAQPYVPATAAPAPAANPEAPRSPAPRAAASLTELRVREQRARRQAARRRADAAQPDAA